jgi:hypothetical protein
MPARPRCAIALFALLAPFAAAAPASAQLAAPATAPLCDEDRPTGDPPTISSRFDLKDAGEGIAFTAARARAIDFCAQQACTIDGKSRTRHPSIYALGMLHRRYVAGFRCLADNGAPSPSRGDAPISYPLRDPSGIDAARVDANAHCAAAESRAELADLRKGDDGFIAVFACGS